MKFLEERNRSDGADGPSSDLEVIDKIRNPDQLTNHLMNTDGRRKERKYKYLRISQIDGACPREWVIGNLLNLKSIDIARFTNVWQMDMGSALHWYVQNSERYFGMTIVGYWKCLACGRRRRFGVRPKEKCEYCGALPEATVYDEYMFRLTDPYRIVGKIDLILRVAKVYRFGEIKTVSKDVDNPDGSHAAQLACYTYFSQFDKDALPIKIDRSVSYICYFNKLFNYRSPVKTFPISVTEPMIKPFKQIAGAITNGIKTRVLPEALKICRPSFKATKAKGCAMRNYCKDFYDKGQVEI